MALALSGCGSDIPTAATFVETEDVGPIVALPDGGIRYGERRTGVVWDVESTGKRSTTPVIDLEVSDAVSDGMLGMAVDDQNRTFASWVSPTGEMVVGQIAPGSPRVVWTGPRAEDTHVGGRLAFTPEKRLLIGIGDLQDRTDIQNNASPNGKLITLDPDRDATQRTNVISSEWTSPQGLVYLGGLLWAVDEGFTTEDRLGRVGDKGMIGKPVDLGDNARPLSLAKYGDSELLACLGEARILRRYLINDVEALPGRTLGQDCTGDVVELTDGRVVYASLKGISVIEK